MNRTYRNMMKICGWLFVVPLLALLPTGCEMIYEDLEACPPTQGGVRLSLSYRIANEEVSTLPIERSDFYIFDSQNKFVCSVTDAQGPFTAEQEYDVSLPEGSYTVVNWANLYANIHLNLDNLIPGETTFEEVNLLLSGVAPSVVSGTRAVNRPTLSTVAGPGKNIYHGIKQNIRVLAGEFTRAVIPLKRNTKVINLSVRYMDDDGTLCEEPSYYSDAWIRTADGILNLDNTYSPCETFLLESATKENEIPGGFNATFRKRTLRLDEPVEPELVLTMPDDYENVVYRGSLTEWLRGTGHTQETIDATHEYQIDLIIGCPFDGEGTQTSVRIFVNGWEYVPMDDQL